MKTSQKLWMGIIVLALLVPLGLLLPEMFNSQTGWGEWSPEALQEMVGYIPKGLQELSGLWKAPFADYSINGDDKGLIYLCLTYVLSAFIGIVAIGLTVLILGKVLIKKDEKK